MTQENKDTETEQPAENIAKEIKPSPEINFSETDAVATDLQTIANTPPTEDMEVHQHTHPAHGKKNWRSYFWEFLMLFLAVFCGFLAEYQLEHKIEKDRENVYMKNMLDDLKYDTVSYKNYAVNANLALVSIDSLIFLLKRPERKIYTNRIYFLARTFTMRNDLLFANERTYDQMRSSGHLRLIHRQEVADSVSYYYNSLKQITNQNNKITERISDYFLSMNKLFDAEVLLKITKDRKMPEGESAKLLTEDPLVINELLTRAQYLYAIFSFTATLGLNRCSSAQNLIALIKKEYHLE